MEREGVLVSEMVGEAEGEEDGVMEVKVSDGLLEVVCVTVLLPLGDAEAVAVGDRLRLRVEVNVGVPVGVQRSVMERVRLPEKVAEKVAVCV